MFKFRRKKSQGNAFVHFFNVLVEQERKGFTQRPVDYRR